jgi:hypothetical protein
MATVVWLVSAPLSTLVHFDNPACDKCSQNRPIIASRNIGRSSEARKAPFFASAKFCGFRTTFRVKNINFLEVKKFELVFWFSRPANPVYMAYSTPKKWSVLPNCEL